MVNLALGEVFYELLAGNGHSPTHPMYPVDKDHSSHFSRELYRSAGYCQLG